MIKMITGKYGLYTDGKVVGMDKNSPPFSIAPEREAELVAAGLAEYVGNGPSVSPAAEAVESAGIVPLEALNANELRDEGKKYGLTFKVGTKKADMVEAITAAQLAAANEEHENDGEEPPVFNAAEAVE